MFDLSGKVAIVTGASRGLGQGMAVGLAKAGATVVGVGIHSMGKTRNLVEEAGSTFHEVLADLTDVNVVDRICYDILATYGKIDILVNNAADIRRAPALEFSEGDWDDIMNINLKSLFFLSQKVARHFVKQGGGKIINIASTLSFHGGKKVASYTASKSGVRGLTMLLANEWAEYNINVNAIAPGYMATENTKALRDDVNTSKDLLARIPAGRWGQPEDMEGIIVFLASDASNYINGVTIPVDGGWLAR